LFGPDFLANSRNLGLNLIRCHSRLLFIPLGHHRGNLTQQSLAQRAIIRLDYFANGVIKIQITQTQQQRFMPVRQGRCISR
jgi:hypothetical protein